MKMKLLTLMAAMIFSVFGFGSAEAPLVESEDPMANIPQVNVGGIVYNLKDTEAREQISDLKRSLKDNNSYNALELMNTDSTTDGGITFTHNSDGSMSVSGTATKDAWFRYCYGELSEWIVPGKKYRMQLDASNTNIILRLYWYIEPTLDTRIDYVGVRGTNEMEVTVPLNCGGLIALLIVENGATVNETVHPKVMFGRTNSDLTERTDPLVAFGYRAINVFDDGYVKEDESGEYVDINDLANPGTYIMDTSMRKINAPSDVVNCVKTEVYGHLPGDKGFSKQTAFNITSDVIDKTYYVRYHSMSNGFTPWVKCAEQKKQNELYHSVVKFNSYDILYYLLYENESVVSGLTYAFSSDGSVHVQGTTTEKSFYEIYRGTLLESFAPGATYYVKMDSASGKVKLRLYFYDSTWTDETRVAYFVASDREIEVPSYAANCIIWFGVEPDTGSSESITVNETCHPAILTKQPYAPTVNNNTFNYTVHNDSYTVNATPSIQSTSDLYLASTGTTEDRTADIMTLLQTQKVCKLGVGDFYIGTGVDMPDGTSIIGCGRGTRVILDSSVTEGYTISVGSYCSVQDLHLTGMSSGSLPYEEYTPGGRDGIVLLGDATGFDGGSTFTHNFAKLSNLWIDNFNGSGVKAYRNDGAASFLAENIDILNCGVGVNIALFSEFHSWENIRTRWCVYACIMNGGNNLFSNCHFDVNMHGLLIDNSLGNLVNDTHSSFTNCTWCHIANNTGNAIEVINTQNGLAFSNCQIFYSKIILTDTKGVTIQGFNIGDNEDIIITRCKGINISNCIFGGDPSIRLDTVSGFIFENNMTKEGILISSPVN